jgi:hypothetical protein
MMARSNGEYDGGQHPHGYHRAKYQHQGRCSMDSASIFIGEAEDGPWCRRWAGQRRDHDRPRPSVIGASATTPVEHRKGRSARVEKSSTPRYHARTHMSRLVVPSCPGQ